MQSTQLVHHVMVCVLSQGIDYHTIVHYTHTVYLCPPQTYCALLQYIDTCFLCSVDSENSTMSASDVLKKQKDSLQFYILYSPHTYICTPPTYNPLHRASYIQSSTRKHRTVTYNEILPSKPCRSVRSVCSG